MIADVSLRLVQFASQCLQYIPERCVVIGNSNSSIEAAHDASMKVSHEGACAYFMVDEFHKKP